jgi:apolipoprotein N-acyltransferase
VVLYSLAFPPANLGLLILVALVPWLNQLRTLDGKGAWRSGLGFGAVYWLFQMFWILPFVGKWTSPGLAMIPWLLCPVIGAWYFAFAGWVIQRCFAMNRAWVIPFVWAGIEAGRSYFPLLAFPWGLAATPLWFLPQLIQPAAAGTIFLVSAWVVLVNLIVANLFTQTVEKPKKGDKGPKIERVTGRLMIVAIGIMVMSIARYSQPLPSGDKKTVAVGQPGVDMAFLSNDDQNRQLEEAVPWLVGEAVRQKADLLILPEGLSNAGEQLPPATSVPNPPPLPLILGGQRGRHPMFQTAFSYSEGKWDYADKTRLVIFGEFVPFRDYIPFLSTFKLPSGDLSPGDKIKALDVDGVRIGPLICFESLFPNIAQAQVDNGARLLAVMSNDDWYMDSSAPDQLRAASVFRAVESGLPLVRSASLGYSLAVDSRGRILGQLPLRTQRILTAELAIPAGSDAFPLRWAFPWICGLAVLYALAGPWLIRKPTVKGS